jgi:hypothetical protein
MALRYEHASEDLDALLARERQSVRVELERGPDRELLHHEIVQVERDDTEDEGEVLELPPLISKNEERCSGGETRTHNLAAPQEPFLYQYPSASPQLDDDIE